MLRELNRLLDWFIPDAIRRSETDLPMVRNFVLLHLLGPLMGHSVTVFLWLTIRSGDWQFWALETAVASFFAIPFVLRITGSMTVSACSASSFSSAPACSARSGSAASARRSCPGS